MSLYHSLFRYEDGKLYWCDLKERGFNKSGHEAGTFNKGYLWVKSKKLPTQKAVHVIIWEMHNGPVPDGFIVDHESRDTLDNRIENLRLATRSQNALNAKGKLKASSLPKNVYRDGKRYRAQVVVGGVTHTQSGLTLAGAVKAADLMRNREAGVFACEGGEV